MARRTRRASKDQRAFDFDTLWAEPETDRLEEDTDEQVRNLLQQQWMVAGPTRVNSLSDPTAHFAQMGERVPSPPASSWPPPSPSRLRSASSRNPAVDAVPGCQGGAARRHVQAMPKQSIGSRGFGLTREWQARYIATVSLNDPAANRSAGLSVSVTRNPAVVRV